MSVSPTGEKYFVRADSYICPLSQNRMRHFNPQNAKHFAGARLIITEMPYPKREGRHVSQPLREKNISYGHFNPQNAKHFAGTRLIITEMPYPKREG